MEHFIAFDWCGSFQYYGRFTHCPSGDTLVQRQGMTQKIWDQTQLKWFRKYPGLTVHNCSDCPYSSSAPSMGSTEEICERLEKRLA